MSDLMERIGTVREALALCEKAELMNPDMVELLKMALNALELKAMVAQRRNELQMEDVSHQARAELRERVLEGLRRCVTEEEKRRCEGCPYEKDCGDMYGSIIVFSTAMAEDIRRVLEAGTC